MFPGKRAEQEERQLMVDDPQPGQGTGDCSVSGWALFSHPQPLTLSLIPPTPIPQTTISNNFGPCHLQNVSQISACFLLSLQIQCHHLRFQVHSQYLLSTYYIQCTQRMSQTWAHPPGTLPIIREERNVNRVGKLLNYVFLIVCYFAFNSYF